MSNFIFGLLVGFCMALLIGYLANMGSMDEGTAFLKTCPEYRVEVDNDKYKLSCENGNIEMSASRYLKLMKLKDSLVNN